MSLILSGTNGLSDVDGTAATPAIRGTDTNTGIFFPAADQLAASVNGIEGLRLTSTGLGIGTSSPGAKLDVYSTSSEIARIQGGSAGAGYLRFADTTNANIAYVGRNNTSDLYIWQQAAGGSIRFGTVNSQVAQFDSSGNLGLGVTPSAWTTYSAFQLGAQSSLAGNASFAILSQNWRYDGADRYIATAAASQYYQGNGAHVWRIAPSGTAGNAISFTQAMTLDASGNLLVGTTSSGGARLQSTVTSAGVYSGYFKFVSGAYGVGIANTSGGSGELMYFFSPNYVGAISTNGSTTTYASASDYRLKENVQPMTGALAKITALKPVTYNWKSTGETGEGFIAHELAEVCPDAVIGEKDAVDAKGKPKYQGIDTSFLVATLTAAIQEQQAMIAQLQADIASLKGTA